MVPIHLVDAKLGWKRLSVDEPCCDMPSLSVFLPKSCQSTLRRHAVTSCHKVTSHGVICHHKMDLCNLYRSHHQKVWKWHLSKWQFWLLNSSEILSGLTPPPNFTSVGQMVKLRECWQTNTHTHTDARNQFYTFDCWSVREKICEKICMLLQPTNKYHYMTMMVGLHKCKPFFKSMGMIFTKNWCLW